MYAREFCYWLQGAFEIIGADSLNAQQRNCIAKHLELVGATPQQDQPAQAISFCGWLSGVIDTIPDTEQSSVIAKIRVRLANVFEHAIDPTYKADAKKLMQIHGPGMRC